MNTTALAPRPDCAAVGAADCMVCERCGHEWLAGDPRPPCDPVTFKVLRIFIDSEAFKAGVALDLTREDKRAGKPVDLGAARRRAAITEKIKHIVDTCTLDPAIKAQLTAAETQPAGRAGKT